MLSGHIRANIVAHRNSCLQILIIIFSQVNIDLTTTYLGYLVVCFQQRGDDLSLQDVSQHLLLDRHITPATYTLQNFDSTFILIPMVLMIEDSNSEQSGNSIIGNFAHLRHLFISIQQLTKTAKT